MAQNFEVTEEPKDRTRLIWLGVVVIFGAMVAALWIMGRPNSENSWVRSRHLLVAYDKNDPRDRARAMELITELRDRLQKGESFSSLVKQYSDDPGSRSHGGDLGEQPKGTFAPEFEAYVWSAPVGQMSDIVSTSFGFHLIIVDERHLSESDKHELELEQKAREALKGQGTAPAPPAKP